jgi:hypothetical protein
MASLYRWGKTKEEILKFMPEVPHDGYRGQELYIPSELPRMCETISKTKKLCLAFKLSAWLAWCYPPHENLAIVRRILSTRG